MFLVISYRNALTEVFGRYSEFLNIPSVGGEPALRLGFIEKDSEY
jgi:hypothetical protein